jgi:hypothetical protein
VTYTRGRESGRSQAAFRRHSPRGRSAVERFDRPHSRRRSRPSSRRRAGGRVASRGAVRARHARSRIGACRRGDGEGHDGGGGVAAGQAVVRLSPRPRQDVRRGRGGGEGIRPGRGDAASAARARSHPGADSGSRRGTAAPRDVRFGGRRSPHRGKPARDRGAPRGARHRDRVGIRNAGRARDRTGRCAGCRGGGRDAAEGPDGAAGAAHRTRRSRLGPHRSAGEGRAHAAPQEADRRGGEKPPAIVRPDDLAAALDHDRHRCRAGPARRRRFPGDRAAERPARADHLALPEGQGALEHPRRRRDDERFRRVVGVLSGRAGARLPGDEPAGVRIAAAPPGGAAVAAGDRLAVRLLRAARLDSENRRRPPRPGHPPDPAPRRRGAPGGAPRGAEGTGRGGAGGAQGGAGSGGAGPVHSDRQRQLRARRGRPRGAARRSHRGLLRGDRHDGPPLPALHAAAHGDLPRSGLRALPGRRHRLLRLPGPPARRGARRGGPRHHGAGRVGPRVPVRRRPAAGSAPLHDRAAGGMARPGRHLSAERPRRPSRRAPGGAADPLRHRPDPPRAGRPAGVVRDAWTGDRRRSRPVVPGEASAAPHPLVRDRRHAARSGGLPRRSGGARGGGGAAGEPAIARLHRRRRREAGPAGRIRRGRGLDRRHAGLLSPQSRDLLPEAARLRAGDRGIEAGECPAAPPQDRRDARGSVPGARTAGRGAGGPSIASGGASRSRPGAGPLARAARGGIPGGPRAGARRGAGVRTAHGEKGGARRRHRRVDPRSRGKKGRRAPAFPAIAPGRPVARLRRRAPLRAGIPRRAGNHAAPGAAARRGPGSEKRRRVESSRNGRGGGRARRRRDRRLPPRRGSRARRGPLRGEPGGRLRPPGALAGGGRGLRAGAEPGARRVRGAAARIGLSPAAAPGAGARLVHARARPRGQISRHLARHGAFAGGARAARRGAPLGGRGAGAPPRGGIAPEAQE